ncbi:hypothetical protein PHLCEN_2v10207 [Hermanssonia centrifuga]|uniref:Flavin reductase like domain-containing protein n=1 Tax=Hermanssonia centrifuga TaxID=98765 RepID=A0A2R6NNP0_9APHY|nr:hypothetical protein PHLCEN_2v10207 [Hermanssonia centrifuga]
MSSTALPPFDVNTQITYVENPHPGWSPGQKTESTPDGKEWQEGEKEGWKVMYTDNDENPIGIVPRPIAFVSSVSETGEENLAPFSWFSMIAHNPPLVSITCLNRDGKPKDTLSNIRLSKSFAVNIISQPFVEQVHITAIDSPPEVSEWDLSGLTKVPSIHIKAPRIKESAFSMECELFQVIDIPHPDTGVATSFMVLGLVKYIHVQNAVLHEDGVVDPTKLKPVAQLGDISYSTFGVPFRIPGREMDGPGGRK